MSFIAIKIEKIFKFQTSDDIIVGYCYRNFIYLHIKQKINEKICDIQSITITFLIFHP